MVLNVGTSIKVSCDFPQKSREPFVFRAVWVEYCSRYRRFLALSRKETTVQA
jgi:hypothetical protein